MFFALALLTVLNEPLPLLPIDCASGSAPAGGPAQLPAQAALPPCDTGPNQQARPRGSTARWIPYYSYLPDHLRMGREGQVGYRLTVAPNGRPIACAITKPSGWADMDDYTCSILMRYARLCPATDDKGVPIEGFYSGRVIWQLPSPPEPHPAA